MGKVTGPLDLEAELRKDNPGAKATDLRVYADALQVYVEASRNIRANGAVCQHPRTGAPIENPYLKIQTAQGAVLAKMPRIKGDRALALLLAEPLTQT